MSSLHNQKCFHNKSSLYSYSNNNFKNNQNYKRIAIMNELLLSNPDLLENFRKRHSKTPHKLRIKSPFSTRNDSNNINSKNLSPKERTKLKIKMNKINPVTKNEKNFKQNKKKKNFREMNTSPLMRHVNIQVDNNRNIKQQKSKNISKKKLCSSHKKEINYNNVLSRSESFSILDKKSLIINNESNINLNKKDENLENNNKIKDNKNNINKNIIDNKENEQKNDINGKENNNNSQGDNNNTFKKNKNKVNKKIYKIESLSQVGYSGPGIIKYNQDNFFVYKNLNDEMNVFYIGVCDGHGLVGHDVSKFLINNLPQNLNRELKKTNKYIAHRETLYSVLKQVFVNTNKDLCKNPSIDTQFSGSTCVTIILTKNKIISANAGDSRAVMGRFINNEWISIDLSHDQKPNNPGEKERILSHGGRIEAYKDENGGDFGPPRVWLKNEDIPGLAMSRSFGDEVAASVGTISEPEIEEYNITNDDKFIIIASDGIWEFISSQECVNFIKDFYLKKDLKGCLKFLLNESSKRWIKEEEVIDDITAVLIFFED